VHKVLRDIGADHVPELLVLNKVDIADPDDVKFLLAAHPRAVEVSAVTGEGASVLLDTLAARLRSLAPIVELLVPYERGDVVAALHREGEVLVEVHAEGGSRLRARLPASAITRFGEFVVNQRA
jgi:GTP-binding protein HflX